ncbi:YgjP-like metallopeptidase domain-containing protein [Anaerotruncus rubiinfantis]|uniref:YgjP-like metallopeptidase domain-containing protein n=1 Tax=Anaerotruncus rubiinfantis TaxID=1720200 RepID=UPI000A7B23CA|nr:YgjP-like metallopeptidase domain-containing protein [Anaerotruncus rubiinfantis]
MRRSVGTITYELTYKRVKNLNLRVTGEGEVRVSAPKRAPAGEIDRFVASRAAWIEAARARIAVRKRGGARPDRRAEGAGAGGGHRIYRRPVLGRV